jgi:hypothetical protein
VTSWMNFFPAFSSAGASLGGFAYCTYAFCPISLLDAGVQLVLRYHGGGMLEALKRLLDICRH